MKEIKTMRTEPAKLESKTRRLEIPKTNDQELGPLKLLPGSGRMCRICRVEGGT